jgi:hypothetical protein
MKATLPELMEKLGVSYTLSPYETCPWAASDSSGQTFSAEARMDPEGNEIECELQLLSDNPEPGRPSVEQLLWMQLTPMIEESWSVKTLRIRNEIWNARVYAWEEKACNLFRACTAELALGNVPDFDDLVQREMMSKERFADSRGGGGGKSPKIRPGQLLNMKTGM